MPSSMPHLIIAKKFNPNASIDFYIGSLAVDSIKDASVKAEAHMENSPNIESALKDLALNASSDYLLGHFLHLYVDWKWKNTHLKSFANNNGEKWFSKYRDEIGKITAFAFHNTEWACNLYNQLEHWDYNGFIETEFIKEASVRDYICSSKKWHVNNDLGTSEAFPPDLIEKFANDVVADFSEWYKI